MKLPLSLFFLTLCPSVGLAQQELPIEEVRTFFRNYTVAGYRPASAMRADSLRVNDDLRTLTVYVNEAFASQPLTPDRVSQLYRQLSQVLPAPYKNYELSLVSPKGKHLEELIPNLLRTGDIDRSRLWGDCDYNGNPWVKNLSRPYAITNGLQNRHLFVWASHGRYYKQTEQAWRWQRPYLFCTTEDLLTQSIVYPYLFPMLERAGAIVGTPRERDDQTAEAVVDNDHPTRQGNYGETVQSDKAWTALPAGSGFAAPSGLLTDSLLPFQQGTARCVATATGAEATSAAYWTPRFPRTGRYAVYVSYASLPQSVSDAQYTVYHLGGQTTVQVNQRMGGGTWVYIGTYAFREGSSTQGRVRLTNRSQSQGIVSADAVRFGGGVGQTEREQAGTSGLPRFLEAARYYGQWAGLPDSLFNSERGVSDYRDDLRVRGYMVNRQSRGSIFHPGTGGESVPFELALALHSDAGYRKDRSLFGSLSICTTQDADSSLYYPSGLSRMASSDFSALLLDGLQRDLSPVVQTTWTRREHWDRNYAETRMPVVPSVILEMLSHQNFTDMKYAHDPYFKFMLARSVYKSVLRFVNYSHGIRTVTVQPLPVRSFAARLTSDQKQVRLTWKPTVDPLEPTASPTNYIVYTKVGNADFDNGQAVGNVNECLVNVQPGTPYAFRVTAVNAGGESFPSETLAAYIAAPDAPQVLLVNGFCRVSGPAWVETADSLGFNLDQDWGVPYQRTTAYAGRQVNFDAAAAGQDGASGLGYSQSDWEGKAIAGNTFDYPVVHGDAIASVGRYSYVSVSKEAFTEKGFSTKPYQVIDYVAGLEAHRPYNLHRYEALPLAVQQKLASYLEQGGSLLLSGAYIASDALTQKQSRHFVEEVLKYRYDGSARRDSADYVNGLNLQLPLYRTPNAEHYAVPDPDAILPTARQAFSVFAYSNGQGAGVAYKGRNYRTVSMTFPFECIKDVSIRRQAMSALLEFLTE